MPTGDAAETTGPSADAAPDGSSDPPPDAATTFEDLPYDLFGEEESEDDAAPASPPSRSSGDRRPGDEAREGSEPSAGTVERAGPVERAAPVASDRSGATRDDEGDDPIEIVQTLFPGRIVAIESPPEPVAENDAPAPARDDEGPGDDDREAHTSDDFASGTSG